MNNIRNLFIQTPRQINKPITEMMMRICGWYQYKDFEKAMAKADLKRLLGVEVERSVWAGQSLGTALKLFNHTTNYTHLKRWSDERM